MPPESMPVSPPNPPEQPPPKKSGQSFSRMIRRANGLSGVAVLVVAVLIVGGAIGFFSSVFTRKTAPAQISVQNLSADDLKKISDLGTNLGSSNQVLTVAANTVFRSKVDVGSDLSVGGHFNANGPVTLSELNISGTTALTGLSVGSNMTVSGNTSLQKGVNVEGLASINGGLNVSGTASVNSLNATSISTRTISISGPLTVGHLATQGPTPGVTAGSVGSGGTVSISGNDTAGTVNINTGSSPTAGNLATVTFRAAYTSTPHVAITALSPAAATAQFYITKNGSGFTISIVNPFAGQIYAFDYIVVQ